MTATLQPETRSSSRRALLAGALGGIGALAATVIGRADPARANDPNDVVLGSASNVATTTTKITNGVDNAAVIFETQGISGYGVYGHCTTGVGVKGSSSSNAGVAGDSSSGVGVYGSSSSSYGLYGTSSSSIGVYGSSFAPSLPASLGWSFSNATGLQGYSNSGGGPLPATKAKTGVFGYANQDTTATGVRGESVVGVGVRGKATTGYAGFFDGRVFTTRY